MVISVHLSRGGRSLGRRTKVPHLAQGACSRPLNGNQGSASEDHTSSERKKHLPLFSEFFLGMIE